MKHADIFSFIKEQEQAYTLEIEVSPEYSWNMKSHIELVNLYKNSKFITGNSDDKPFKNIILPILNLHYRATGFDVKDIVLFINDSAQYFKSFLVKKFHEKWARENHIDTFIDDMVESYIDYGAALIKNEKGIKTVVVPLQSIAFCDQTDLLGGPIGIRHYYSPDELKEMQNNGWENVDELIVLSESKKVVDKQTGKSNKTPGQYIEVYEIHGVLPECYLTDEPSDDYVSQMQIVAFYTDENGGKQGMYLYRKEETKSPFKIILRDKIYGRALGRSAAEELFEPQVWINYSMIRRKEMLDEAAKIFYKTTDGALATRNNTRDMQTGTILELQEGRDISQVDNYPRNDAIFSKFIEELKGDARQLGAANESILGESPSAGTPFKLQELVTRESHSLHEYRKGKIASFLADELYPDWILPYISKEIVKGQEFLADLDLDELEMVAENVSASEANKKVIERILNGQLVSPEEVEVFKTEAKERVLNRGNSQFIKILKDELKNVPMSIRVNIAGKQKDLAATVDKLGNLMKFALSTYDPNTGTFGVSNDPTIMKLLNQILEASNLSPITHSFKPKLAVPQQPRQISASSLDLAPSKLSPIPTPA